MHLFNTNNAAITNDTIPMPMYAEIAKLREYAIITCAMYGVTITPILIKELAVPTATALMCVG